MLSDEAFDISYLQKIPWYPKKSKEPKILREFPQHIYLVFLEKPQVSIEITKNPRETPRNENSPLIPQETRKFSETTESCRSQRIRHFFFNENHNISIL